MSKSSLPRLLDMTVYLQLSLSSPLHVATLKLKRAPLGRDCVVSVSLRHFRAVPTCSGDGTSCELSSSVVTVALLRTKMVPFHALDSSSAQARTPITYMLYRQQLEDATQTTAKCF